MPRKVVITGASGLLGRQVVSAFKQAGWTTVGTGFSRVGGEIRKLDVNDILAIEHLLDDER